MPHVYGDQTSSKTSEPRCLRPLKSEWKKVYDELVDRLSQSALSIPPEATRHPPPGTILSYEEVEALAKSGAVITARERKSQKRQTIPLRMQGDIDLHKPEALSMREKLRDHPKLLEELGRWWSVTEKVPGATPEQMRREEYLRILLLVLERLTPYDTPSSIIPHLEADLAVDVGDAEGLDQDRFFDALFQAVDHWTPTVKLDDYLKLLDQLWASVTKPMNQRPDVPVRQRSPLSPRRRSAPERTEEVKQTPPAPVSQRTPLSARSPQRTSEAKDKPAKPTPPRPFSSRLARVQSLGPRTTVFRNMLDAPFAALWYGHARRAFAQSSDELRPLVAPPSPFPLGRPVLSPPGVPATVCPPSFRTSSSSTSSSSSSSSSSGSGSGSGSGSTSSADSSLSPARSITSGDRTPRHSSYHSSTDCSSPPSSSSSSSEILQHGYPHYLWAPGWRDRDPSGRFSSYGQRPASAPSSAGRMRRPPLIIQRHTSSSTSSSSSSSSSSRPGSSFSSARGVGVGSSTTPTPTATATATPRRFSKSPPTSTSVFASTPTKRLAKEFSLADEQFDEME